MSSYLDGRVKSGYEERTAKSKELFAEATKVMPAGITHNGQSFGLVEFGTYPFYVKRAKGQYVWDVDNNRYVDYWCGNFALILGHANDEVVRSVSEQVALGTHYGMVHEKMLQHAKLISELVPSAEMVRFCNTGTEATMYAARLARGFTGRRTIIKMEGGWHGGNTDLNYAVRNPLDLPESLGLEARNIVAIPFNDLDYASKVIQRYSDDLAGIILEPFLAAGGGIPADVEFLRLLREETSKHNALLIFDEVVTGFRIGLGGAQEYYHIPADLITLGKIAGGGLPIGVVCGKKEVMECADLRKSKSKYVWIGGGTFSGNPLTTTAGTTTLKILKNNTGIYRRIADYGKTLRDAMMEYAGKVQSCTLQVAGMESFFFPHFLKEPVEKLHARTIFEKTDKRFTTNYFVGILSKGVFPPHGGGAVSSTHSQEDIEDTIRAFGEAMKEAET